MDKKINKRLAPIAFVKPYNTQVKTAQCLNLYTFDATNVNRFTAALKHLPLPRYEGVPVCKRSLPP